MSCQEIRALSRPNLEICKLKKYMLSLVKGKERQRMWCNTQSVHYMSKGGEYREKWTGEGRERCHVKIKSLVRAVGKDRKNAPKTHTQTKNNHKSRKKR